MQQDEEPRQPQVDQHKKQVQYGKGGYKGNKKTTGQWVGKAPTNIVPGIVGKGKEKMPELNQVTQIEVPDKTSTEGSSNQIVVSQSKTLEPVTNVTPKTQSAIQGGLSYASLVQHGRPLFLLSRVVSTHNSFSPLVIGQLGEGRVGKLPEGGTKPISQ
ncbi:hypothetical protein K7X08_002448 [Anisodus acutangulus]|uniref:Uncharacterized protein n=1 Tax=Anisodus acutangulus TaxID=402998 RepID=A0A9Q1LSX9_9SOLA|nr:hypothetical protein K7X08_002448 [Anisodus acutangulus]